MSKYRIKRFSFGTALMKAGNAVAKSSYARNAVTGAAVAGIGKMASNAIKGNDLTQGVGGAMGAGAAAGGLATAATRGTASMMNKSEFKPGSKNASSKDFDALIKKANKTAATTTAVTDTATT